MTKSPPLLIHIGFQRTMTSWLQRELFSFEGNDFQLVGGQTQGDHKSRTSPIFSTYPPFHDFAAELTALLKKDIDQARSKGKVPVISNEALCGNSFAGSYDSKIIADALKQAYPEAKILIGIREQSDLILSNWSRHIAAGGYLSPAEWATPKHYKDLRYPVFNRHSYLFADLVAYYQKLFGSKNVLTQPIELFYESPERYVENVFKFCGMKTQDYGDAREIVNENHDIAYIALMRHVNGVLGYPLFKEGRVKNKIRHILQKLVQMLARLFSREYKKEQKQAYKHEIKAALKNYYAQSNTDLIKLTGLDLSRYGYKTATTKRKK